MAKRSMEYAHSAYLVPQLVPVDIPATTVAFDRFAAYASLVLKAAQFTVVTAGTGTGINTLTLTRQASGGSALTTYTQVSMSTQAAGYTTNVLLTGTLSAGDVFTTLKGAEATGVIAGSIEYLIAPGADVTA